MRSEDSFASQDDDLAEYGDDNIGEFNLNLLQVFLYAYLPVESKMSLTNIRNIRFLFSCLVEAAW